MEEKKDQKDQIGENTSSGAEKVKTIEKTVKKTPAQKAAGEKKSAEKRVKTARAKAEAKDKKSALKIEKKEKRIERKLAVKENRAKRKAEAKENAAKRRAERAARRDLIKNESATQRLERKEREKKARLQALEKAKQRRHELALKRKEERLKRREQRLEDKQHRREQRNARRAGDRAPGFGGWLAAVISLGVVSLIMATVITAGAIGMNGMYGGMVSGYARSVYELDSSTDSMQTSLNKLRVASSAREQSALLSDLLAQSQLAESAVEELPLADETAIAIGAFFNKTRDFSKDALRKLVAGEPLSESDRATLDYLYETNSEIRRVLDETAVSLTVKDMMMWAKDKEEKTLSAAFQSVAERVAESPETLTDGAFSNKTAKKASALAGYDEISSSEGAELLFDYFAGYDIREAECTGEIAAQSFAGYNYTLRDGRGREYFAQLSKQGGKLVMFESFEDCSAYNYSLEKCVAIAEQFLEKAGIQNMKAVWENESGTAAEIRFVAEQDGVLLYPDAVSVRVCETRGKVTGMEAYAYWTNHARRDIPAATVSEEQVNKSLAGKEVSSLALALVESRGEEVLAYRAAVRYGGEDYVLFFDAATGDELALYAVVHSDRGRNLY